jgi:hypothetical protein
LDRGLLDGVEPGDRGAIYYTLQVRGESKRVDVGWGEITSAEDRSSTMRANARRPVGPGYSVDLEPPAARFSATRLFGLARERHRDGRTESALLYLDLIRERLGDDPFAKDQIAAFESELQDRARAAEERENLGYYIAAARHYAERDDVDMARSYLDRARALDQAAPEIVALERDLEQASAQAEIEQKRADMVRLPGDTYTIGIDPTQARFFNQSPPHEVRIEETWIDRQPVSVADFRVFRTGFRRPRGATAPEATGVAYGDAQAYCRAQDKRLPDEREWEAAAAAGLLEASTGMNEWTASWYDAYPGSTHEEDAYGQTHRVLRRLRDEEGATFQRRRFLQPAQSHPSVGFRCAEQAS